MKVSLESVLERPKGVEEWSPSIVSVDATDEEYVAFYDQHPERERMRGHRDEGHAQGSIVSPSS